jgi:hypothetical protein
MAEIDVIVIIIAHEVIIIAVITKVCDKDAN